MCHAYNRFHSSPSSYSLVFPFVTSFPFQSQLHFLSIPVRVQYFPPFPPYISPPLIYPTQICFIPDLDGSSSSHLSEVQSSLDWLCLSSHATSLWNSLKCTPLCMTVSSMLFSLDTLSLIALLIVTCVYLLHAISHFYGRYKLHHPVKRSKSSTGVSILKPLVGTDPNLETNLRSFFALDYLTYELLFCVQDSTDECIPLVRQLMAQYPHIDSSLFIGGEEVGLNPKINNMMPGYRASKHPLVLISDSGIFMRPDAITDMVNAMKDEVALVTQIPFCRDRSSFGSQLEQIYFGTSHARIYLAGNFLGAVCSTGMSSMMRKQALEEVGGMGSFGAYLAEDFFFGLALTRKGWKCGLSSLPALQNSGNVTSETFDARVQRWVRLRFAMLPYIIVLEPLQDWVSTLLMVSLSISHLFAVHPLLVAVIHSCLWFTSDYMLFSTLHNGPPSFSLFSFFLTWLRRELTMPISYIKALVNSEICWRNGKYRLEWGGRIKKMPKEKQTLNS